MASDGKHGHLGLVELANQLHISKHRGISRVVEHRAVGDRQNKSCRDAHLVGSVFIGGSRRMFGFDHRGRHVVQLHRAAQIHADGAGDTLAADIGRQLIDCYQGRAVFLSHRHGIRDMVPMAVRQQDVLDLQRQGECLWVFGILRDKRIDQNICAAGGLDKHRSVTKPCDPRFLQISHDSLPPPLPTHKDETVPHPSDVSVLVRWVGVRRTP